MIGETQPVGQSRRPGLAGDTPVRVLVVDDQRDIRRVVSRWLEHEGHDVIVAASGAEALQALQSQVVDVVVSDIAMDGMDGIALMRAIREIDLDLPIILLTGVPSLETARRAIEYGAFRYLTKPAVPDEVTSAVSRAAFACRMARLKREALALSGTNARAASDLAGLDVAFERALAGLWIAHQPIVRRGDGSVFGYEALMRTREPSLPHPGAVLDAAERLGRLKELGRAIRGRVARSIGGAAEGSVMFVNLHPDDLLDDALVSGRGPLAEHADRVVLEITERATISHVPDVRKRVVALRALGYRIAVDDLGAGYAGLTSFALLEPEIVKLDMSLVRDVDREPTKRRIIGSVVSLCSESGAVVVAEGVETEAERDAIVDLGCDLLQGYFIAKPAEGFPPARW